MKQVGASLGALSVAAATRDLRTPLVRLRQLAFEVGQCGAEPITLARMQSTLTEALGVVDELSIASSPLEDLVLEPVSVDRLLMAVQAEVQSEAQQLSCQFICVLPKRSPLLTGNYNALKQLLVRFSLDALRYSRKTVKLSARLTRNREVVLELRDNGAPFAKDVCGAVYINQLNPVASRPLMSSLNLLLAEQITRAMQGSIAFHCHRQGGMTIEAHLPESRQLSLLELI